MIGDFHVCYLLLQEGKIARYAFQKPVKILSAPRFIDTLKVVSKNTFIASSNTTLYALDTKLDDITQDICESFDCKPEDIRVTGAISVNDTMIKINKDDVDLATLDTGIKYVWHNGIAVDINDELYSLTRIVDQEIFYKVIGKKLDIKDSVGKRYPHILTSTGEVWLVSIKPRGFPTMCKTPIENVHKIVYMEAYHQAIFLTRTGQVMSSRKYRGKQLFRIPEKVCSGATDIFSNPATFAIVSFNKLTVYDYAYTQDKALLLPMTYQSVEYDVSIKSVHIMSMAVLVMLMNGEIHEIPINETITSNGYIASMNPTQSKRLTIFDEHKVVAFRKIDAKR